MKAKFVLAVCVAVLACACQQKQMDKGNGNGQKMDDQNFQDRRKEMQQNQKPQSGGCCEAGKIPSNQSSQTVSVPPVQKSQTVSAPVPEVKSDKSQ
jgi:septal ring-binding cell division protein DamX